MWSHVAVVTLLIVGVGIELACCLGIVAMDTVFDRLHYLGPATTLGSCAIAAAVVVTEGLSQAGIKALLIAVLLGGMSPVLTHATARAARTRQFGDWAVQSDEEVEGL